MNWLNGLVKKTSNKRKSTPGKRTARRPSGGKRMSRGKRGSGRRVSRGSKPKTRYYVKTDNRVVTAYKREGGTGYVYRKRTPNGVRNVPINGTTYKTERDAKKKAQVNRERKR